MPLFVISPWRRGGWVNSQVVDHTSLLRFLEARFGVKEPNISPIRRAVCGDLTSAFNCVTPNTEALPVLAGRTSKSQADALRAAQQALPYELATTCDVQPGATMVAMRAALTFINTGRQGAAFHVYQRKNLAALPRRYTVEPDKALAHSWAPAVSAAFDLWVLGPNGYHRQFTGSARRPAPSSCWQMPTGRTSAPRYRASPTTCAASPGASKPDATPSAPRPRA